MQLIKYILIPITLGLASVAFGQTDSLAVDTTAKKLGPIEVDILASYYTQDGEHSPVTGGRGTEDLSDLTSTIIINIPYGKNTYNVNVGSDNITSASTDNIDTEVSSDSKKDTRVHGNFGITHKISKRKSYNINAGFSSEYDVQSFSLSAGFSLESKNRNSSFDVNAKVYSDTWSLYEPYDPSTYIQVVDEDGEMEIEIEPSGTDNRTSYDVSISFAQILTKKLQVSITADVIYQKGLLSTPFHRVYFNDGVNTAQLNEIKTILSTKTRRRELLPGSRLKTPVAMRLHYSISGTFVVRSFYRYYTDDFGVTAHTVELEVPVKVGNALTFYPFYRYHDQSASKYFAPFGEHLVTSEFYTSDYDLSAFDSKQYGLGLEYAPLFGVGKKAINADKGFLKLKSINARLANYERSDGLSSYLLSFGLSFQID